MVRYTFETLEPLSYDDKTAMLDLFWLLINLEATSVVDISVGSEKVEIWYV